MVQEILVASLAPHVNHNLLIAQNTVPRPILVPKTLQPRRICQQQENDAHRDLATEEVLLQKQPSAHLGPVNIGDFALFV